MNEAYMDGLKADLKKHCLGLAKELEIQAIETLECEPDAERVVEMAGVLEEHLEKIEEDTE